MGKLDDILTLPSGGRFVGLLPHLDAEIGKSFARATIKNYTFQPAAALDVNRPDCGYRIRGLDVELESPGVGKWTVSLQVGRMVLDSSIGANSGEAELAAAKILVTLQKAILRWSRCHTKELVGEIDRVQGVIAKVRDGNLASGTSKANWHVLNCVFDLSFRDSVED
jgi:hypothetical protein